MKTEELYSATITFNTNRILLVKFKDGVEVDIEELKRLVNVSLELVAGTPFYLLIDARNILSSIDHEARDYFSKHKEYNDLNIAQAIVVNNTPIRLLANFYLRFYKHQNPVKIFNSIENAESWLFLQD